MTPALLAVMEAWDAVTAPQLRSAETAAARLANLGHPDEEADIVVTRERAAFLSDVRERLGKVEAENEAVVTSAGHDYHGTRVHGCATCDAIGPGHEVPRRASPVAGPSSDPCEHRDVRPIPGDSDWGRCVSCGDSTFPLTARAAGYTPSAPRASSDLESAAEWLTGRVAKDDDWTLQPSVLGGPVQWRTARDGRRVDGGRAPSLRLAIIEAAKSLGWGGK